jgi:CheY-like chemotaxis protein
MTNSKILIVDDEPFNVDYLEQELEESDYKIISAVNGREGLDKVQAELPDLILLDIMMPVVDGFEMLKCLKANSATRDIPGKCCKGDPTGCRGLFAQAV